MHSRGRGQRGGPHNAPRARRRPPGGAPGRGSKFAPPGIRPPPPRRYDRLAAELASVQVTLADCVLQLEAETNRLREELARLTEPAETAPRGRRGRS